MGQRVWTATALRRQTCRYAKARRENQSSAMGFHVTHLCLTVPYCMLLQEAVDEVRAEIATAKASVQKLKVSQSTAAIN